MYSSTARARIAPALAAAFLAGSWNEARLAARGRQALDPAPRWMRAVAREVLAAYHRPPLDRPRELARFVEIAIARLPASPTRRRPPRIARWFTFEQRMAERRPWPVPELHTVGDLALLLEVYDAARLDWMVDARGLERHAHDQRLRNYRYTWIPRPGAPPRVLEAPKARLKAAQRLVLHEILDRIPAHDASHGFVRGRSLRSHASLHVGRRVVIRFDLEDFFASVGAGRVYGIFRTAGYSEGVAHALTALCTNVVPLADWHALPRPRDANAIDAHHRLGQRLATPHLPQGAPTSPALANLCAFGLDRRLSGLADSVGASYSRYADDLVLSGDEWLLKRAASVRALVQTIARDEGFQLNERKSRLMTSAGRQRVTGVVVNERPNVSRREYDRLKATLHNAAVRGPEGENRAGVPDFRAHLLGRIAWVESLHAERGRRLRARFERIEWPAGG